MSVLLRRNSSQLRLLLSSGGQVTRLSSTANGATAEPPSAAMKPVQAKKPKTPPVVPDTDIKKSVFISQSSDVFTNLALEDWLYKNFDFSHHHVLLLWANDPCVVIGRHQNPFTEANVSRLVERGITLARRNSGGGAVYHDLGNLNCTFFAPRERYDRKYNLNIVTRALFREWAINAEINERDDIVVRNKKVGGTRRGIHLRLSGGDLAIAPQQRQLVCASVLRSSSLKY